MFVFCDERLSSGVRHIVHWRALDACGLNVRGSVVTLSNDIQDEPFFTSMVSFYTALFSLVCDARLSAHTCFLSRAH